VVKSFQYLLKVFFMRVGGRLFAVDYLHYFYALIMEKSMKPFRTLLYYKYINIPEAATFTEQHLQFCQRIGLVGRIIIADEGINGTVSGTIVQCQKYMDMLNGHPLLKDIDFKIDDVDAPSFFALHVRYKEEIVNSGSSEFNINPTRRTGMHLEPEQFADMMHQDDVVILDVRSNYESGLGRFKSAIAADIDNFRDFPDYIKHLEQYKDKKVMTYCTGGIKCEKASALLLEAGFKNVYQLHGGIVKYGKEMQGKDFEGNCYVFDNRVSVPVNSVNPSIISKCRICSTASTHMINCANPECNEHFVLCEECGWQMKGCCSEACLSSSTLRVYDGTGYYSKY
jgi:UPF0176 protein